MAVSVGLDFGEKRIGVAVSDESGVIAEALKTIEFRSQKQLLADLEEIVKDYRAAAVVVGLPKTLAGEIGPAALHVLKHVEWLKARLQAEWVLWDERLTTKEVERMLVAADISRRKRAQVRDRLSAQRILQSYLDHLRFQPPQPGNPG
jgi:putative Holliday junction resolvase